MRFLARMRVKPSATLIPARNWRDWLYAEPFEGNELGYTDALIQSVTGFDRNAKSLSEIHDALKAFHERVSTAHVGPAIQNIRLPSTSTILARIPSEVSHTGNDF